MSLSRKPSITLLRHQKAEDLNWHCNYGQVIEKPTYLENVQDWTFHVLYSKLQLVAQRKILHGQALKWLGHYHVGTSDKGTNHVHANNGVEL